jgi:Protein of unknown function (DUF2013)
MVAELATKPQNDVTNVTNTQNRVLHVLVRRHGTSQTFGENLIFMLNRAGEDFVLILFLLILSERSYQDVPLRTSLCSYWS